MFSKSLLNSVGRDICKLLGNKTGMEEIQIQEPEYTVRSEHGTRHTSGAYCQLSSSTHVLVVGIDVLCSILHNCNSRPKSGQ